MVQKGGRNMALLPIAKEHCFGFLSFLPRSTLTDQSTVWCLLHTDIHDAIPSQFRVASRTNLYSPAKKAFENRAKKKGKGRTCRKLLDIKQPLVSSAETPQSVVCHFPSSPSSYTLRTEGSILVSGEDHKGQPAPATTSQPSRSGWMARA